MRLRSVVLPAVVALAAVVTVPSSASAASQCSLVMPTKVAVDSPMEAVILRLSSNCETSGANQALWHLTVPEGGSFFPIDFTPADFASGINAYEFGYVSWDHGTWTAVPQGASTADETPLTQNTPTTVVKYGGRIAATVTRTSTALTWAATATSWSPNVDRMYPRAGASLSVWYLPTGSTTWQWVKAVKTSSTGKATVSVGSPKAGQYRLGIAETATVWAAYSTTIKGRV